MVTCTAGRLPVPRRSTISGGTTKPVAVLPAASSSVRKATAPGAGAAALAGLTVFAVLPGAAFFLDVGELAMGVPRMSGCPPAPPSRRLYPVPRADEHAERRAEGRWWGRE